MAPNRKLKRNTVEDGEAKQPNKKKISQPCDAVETTPVKTPSRKSVSRFSYGDGETSPVKAPLRNSGAELSDVAETLPVKKKRSRKSEKQSCDGGEMRPLKKRPIKSGRRKRLGVVPLKQLLLSALIAEDGGELFGQIGENGDECQLDEWILKELRTIGLLQKTVPELAEGDDENTNEIEWKRAEKCRKQNKETDTKTSGERKQKKKPKLKSLLSAYGNDIGSIAESSPSVKRSITESSPSVKRKRSGRYKKHNKVQETEASAEVGRSSLINAKDEHKLSTLETETPSLVLPSNNENGVDQKAGVGCEGSCKEMLDDFFELVELDEADKMRTQADIHSWLDIGDAEESDAELDLEGLPAPPDNLYTILGQCAWLDF